MLRRLGRFCITIAELPEANQRRTARQPELSPFTLLVSCYVAKTVTAKLSETARRRAP